MVQKVRFLIMKKCLITTLVIWVISIPIIIRIVNNYVEAKDERLRAEFNCTIENIFNGREYVDVVYSGKKVSYEKMSIPERPRYTNQDSESLLGDFGKRALNRWKEFYGDLREIYRIKNDHNEWDIPFEEEDGWSLIKISSSHDSNGDILLVKQWLFPYAVGYIKQDYWGYDYTTSVRSAVNETFDFFTSDPKSVIYKDFERGSSDRINNEIREADNQYYTILRDTIPEFWQIGEPVWGMPIFANKDIGGRIVSPMTYTYMHNGYYRVFVGITQPTTWSLKRRGWAVESDRDQILKGWLISSGSLFAIIIITLSILLYRQNKKINESDYEKLLRLSHPRNFMNPYDKDKVEKANLIYKEVETVDDNDSDTINILIQRCIDELSISFIDQAQLSELKKLVNPKRFMNPYDAQKIQLANQLFSILNSDNLSFADFKEVCDKAKTLNV